MQKADTCDALGSIEENIPVNVQHIRRVLQDEYNVTVPMNCDQFIARCLRQKDGDIDKAIHLLISYKDTISSMRQWDITMLPGTFRDVFDSGLLVPLGHPDPSGRYIVIFRVGLWDPQQCSFEHIAAFLWMLHQYNQSERIDMQRNGFVTVWDYTGFSLSHALATKPTMLLTLVKWTKNGVGGRLKRLHLINLPKPAQILFKTVRPFLSEKLQQRVIVHDNLESLLKVMDRKYLPTIVGGDLDQKECIDASLVNAFFNSDQYFIDMLETGLPPK